MTPSLPASVKPDEQSGGPVSHSMWKPPCPGGYTEQRQPPREGSNRCMPRSQTGMTSRIGTIDNEVLTARRDVRTRQGHKEAA